MKMIQGTYKGFKAEKYNDGSVYYKIAKHWYRPIGQENKFIAN